MNKYGFWSLIFEFSTVIVLYTVILRKNPARFIYHCLAPLLCAVGSSSSTVTLPYTIYSLEQQPSLDRRVTRFFIPIGTVMNKNGTTFWLALTATYLSNIEGMPFESATLFTCLISSTVEFQKISKNASN